VTARTGGETMAVAPVPRLALTREEAAAALGMSLDSFERHVQPTLRLVRLGRMRLVPIAELERWLEENASGTLDGAA
jgi:excisionase family DNA binding protein